MYGMHDGMVFCSDLQGNRLSGKEFSIVSHYLVAGVNAIARVVLACSLSESDMY